MQETCYYCNIVLVKYRQSSPKHKDVITPPNARTLDHLVPQHIRKSKISLKVACCASCNQDKGRLTLDEFRVVMAFRKGIIAESDMRFPGEK